MSGGFATRPDEIEAAAGRFDEAARVVADALDALRSTLGGLGEYVGSDAQGHAFAARYDPAVAEATDALGAEAAAVRAVGDALRGTARDYRGDDDTTAARLRAAR